MMMSVSQKYVYATLLILYRHCRKCSKLAKTIYAPSIKLKQRNVHLGGGAAPESMAAVPGRKWILRVDFEPMRLLSALAELQTVEEIMLIECQIMLHGGVGGVIKIINRFRNQAGSGIKTATMQCKRHLLLGNGFIRQRSGNLFFNDFQNDKIDS